MQYISPSTVQQKIVFSKPTNTTSTTETLRFTSYDINFSVTATISQGINFAQATFTLSAAQAAYFVSGTTFKVYLGTSYEYVQGIVPSSEVIQYDPE